MTLVRPEQNQKLADEAVEHGQAERRKGHKQEKCRELRHGCREPAKLADFERVPPVVEHAHEDRKSTRLNSSHGYISYAVFCLKKKNKHVTDLRLGGIERVDLAVAGESL